MFIGLIYAGGGALLAAFVVGTVAEEVIRTHSLAASRIWQLWTMLALGVGAVGLGWLAFRWGRGMDVAKHPRIPARTELLSDHPRNKLSPAAQQARPVARELGGAGVSAVYVGLWVGLLWAGHDWAWVGLFFLPEIAILASEWAHERQTGECG